MSFSLANDIVEMVILTTDEAFLLTLREAMGGSRRLWHVLTADKVSDLLVAGQVGILILDVQALHEPPTRFVSQIKRQFPDLVIVAAGRGVAEASLTELISVGAIHRFIHLPVSPGRARLFADAAVKRYDEQRRLTRPSIVHAPPPEKRRRLIVAGAGIAVPAIVLAVAALLHHASTASVADRRAAGRADAQPVETPLLARAATALADNRLSSPLGDNALELYTQALTHNPSEAAARAGLTEVRERLLARAQNALLEERLDEAAGAIDIARQAGADSGRLALMSSQLARARARLRLAGTQRHAGDAHGPRAAADAERLARALNLAAQRMQQGRLIEPDQDDARSYVTEALRIDPNGSAAIASGQSLAGALLSGAHDAIQRGQFSQAVILLDGASGIASPSNINGVLRELRTARMRTAPARTEREQPD